MCVVFVFTIVQNELKFIRVNVCIRSPMSMLAFHHISFDNKTINCGNVHIHTMLLLCRWRQRQLSESPLGIFTCALILIKHSTLRSVRQTLGSEAYWNDTLYCLPTRTMHAKRRIYLCTRLCVGSSKADNNINMTLYLAFISATPPQRPLPPPLVQITIQHYNTPDC